jgi:hypothetical protein
MNDETFFLGLQFILGCGCLFLNLLIIFASVSVANRKNRNPLVWGVLAFFFSFWPLLILFLLPANRPAYAHAHSSGLPPQAVPPSRPPAPPRPPPPPPASPPHPATRAAPPAPQAMHETMLHTGPRLAIVGGPDSGQNYALGQQTRLGRSPDNEIALTDPQVSRYHALIQRQKQEYIISDLGSGNGVYLNGRLVERATQLKAGDVITLGNTQMRFE